MIPFGNKVIEDWECPNKKCKHWEFTKAGWKKLEPSLRDVKEGRTYLWACSTKTKKSKRCAKSGEKLWICPSCHVKDCEKWYKLGKSDERKKWRKLYGRSKIKGNGTGHTKK
jgi:hypothetical protein